MKPVTLESLSPRARHLAEACLEWMEPYGEGSELLLCPTREGSYGGLDISKQKVHLMRESAWWATGLLLRNRGDDVVRAHRILETVLRWQFDEPGMPYHGTFHRAPEEKLPPGAKAHAWRDYDPNWRQFIGTTWIPVLEMLGDRLTQEMRTRLEASVRLAVEGETPERIVPSYTNIAMMQVGMLAYAGHRFARPDWQERGRALARQIHELFAAEETFSEYNSPTYYGVNLYGLRLWRLFSQDAAIAAWGKEMETSLWRQIGRYYHPGLRNICGPFDRAYGMDMTRYTAMIGLGIGLAVEPEVAPYPSLKAEFDHAHDFCSAIVVALAGAEIPPDALQHLQEFKEDRAIRQVIETQPALRIAMARLQDGRMWGAESGGSDSGFQFHPATAHWRQPNGTVGWLRALNSWGTVADAVADDRGIQLTVQCTAEATKGQLTWEFSSSAEPRIGPDKWIFPGMTIHVATDQVPPSLRQDKTGRYTLAYEVTAGREIKFSLAFPPDTARR